MESNKRIVSLVEYDNTVNPLREAIENCQGFTGLKPENNILIKPNIVWGGGMLRGVPKFGFITTTRMIEDIIIILKEKGFKNITVGEGTVIDKVLGSTTKKGFKWTNVKKIVKKYGVKLVDLNAGAFKKVQLEDLEVEISEAVLNADFVINVPVLKTHLQTKISLCLKNLKGCISHKSRREIHKKGLSKLIANLGSYIKPNLNIIDGIYGLELGPTCNGKAHRMNVIIVGKDAFSCDIVGASILGIDPVKVPMLQSYAKVSGESLDLNNIVIMGKSIEDLKKEMKWEVDFNDFLRNSNISGLKFQRFGDTVCTGCATALEANLVIFCEDFKGTNLNNIEICTGSEVKALKDSEQVILLGNCAIGANKEIKEAIRIKGCPPNSQRFLTALYGCVGKKMVLFKRMMKLLGLKLHVYNEDLSNKRYDAPLFDVNHFK